MKCLTVVPTWYLSDFYGGTCISLYVVRSSSPLCALALLGCIWPLHRCVDLEALHPGNKHRW